MRETLLLRPRILPPPTVRMTPSSRAAEGTPLVRGDAAAEAVANGVMRRGRSYVQLRTWKTTLITHVSGLRTRNLSCFFVINFMFDLREP